MSIYITKFNYGKLINKLDILMHTDYLREFYKQYKISEFDLDLKTLSNNDAKLLVISDKLSKNINSIYSEMVISYSKIEEDNLVYRISAPTYHNDGKCTALHSDYVNAYIPPSVIKNKQTKEYRQYYIDNIEKYHNHIDENKLTELAKDLKIKFNLKDSYGDIIKYYIKSISRKNSGTIDENFDKFSHKERVIYINKLILIYFKAMNEFINIYSESEFKYTFYSDKAKGKFDGDLSLNKYYQLYLHRRSVVHSILRHHFLIIQEKGLDVSEHFLSLIGFKPCSHCCK